MSDEYQLSFSATATSELGEYKLLSLPTELCSLIDAAVDSEVRFDIKGDPKQDAVFCTSDTTYSMRSVVLSNAVLVVTSPPDDEKNHRLPENTVVIRDSINEVIELTPIVPKLHQLDSVLEGLEYDESSAEQDDEQDESRSISYDAIRSLIQASDGELERGLRQRRILNLNGLLRPIASVYLINILENVLNLLVSLRLKHDSASIQKLCDALANQQEVPHPVSTQVLSWFGQLQDGKWTMNIVEVVKTIGLGVVQKHQREPVKSDDLLAVWRNKVGDTFEAFVDLELLSGNVLASASNMNEDEVLTYFPRSSLPVDPSARFSELFSARQRWKQEDIAPFLEDIAVDSKARDQLLLKYARAITDAEGIWYTARTTYAG